MRPLLNLFLALSLAMAPLAATAAPACMPPAAWPLGDHVGEFAVTGNRVVPTQGWDPAFFPNRGHQQMKEALTVGIPTYEVGLPGSTEPGDLTPWTGSCEWSPSALAAAGMPQISLTSEGGGTINGVYLVSGYNMQGCGIWLQDGVKVAVHNSAFQDIRQANAIGGVWIVDSLIDNPGGKKGAFRGGEKSSTCSTHLMYSELMGGLDAGKTHNQTYYRNHVHGSMKIDDGHADGLQINSSSNCTFLYENNVDHLFRMTNVAIFLQNSNPQGIHNTVLANNLVSGGRSCFDVCDKPASNAPRFGPCTDSVICGNRCIGDNGNVSWANPSKNTSGNPAALNNGDGISGYHYRENNGFFSASGGHRLTVTDNEGDSHTIKSTPLVPQSKKDEINARVALIETWATQIREAAGAVGNSAPTAPPLQTPLLLP